MSRRPDQSALARRFVVHVLVYNLKRVINIMGIRPLIAAMSAA